MKNLKFQVIESTPGVVTLPELDLQVSFELLSVDLIEVGDGIVVLNTYVKITDTHITKPGRTYSGIVSGEVTESMLNRQSDIKSEKPAHLALQLESGKRLDLFTEGTVARYSDTHINGLGAPLFNITTLTGVKFA